jgi:hypothetical protein
MPRAEGDPHADRGRSLSAAVGRRKLMVRER